MAIYDNYRIRFNTALNTLEMNVGAEDWEPVPSGGGPAASITTYSPTIVGFGTIANSSFFYKTDGVSVEVWGTFQAGTPTGVTASITIPVAIDSAHLSTSYANIGQAHSTDTDLGPRNYVVFYDGTDTAKVYINNSYIGTAGNPVPDKGLGTELLDATAYASVHFSYPIA